MIIAIIFMLVPILVSFHLLSWRNPKFWRNQKIKKMDWRENQQNYSTTRHKALCTFKTEIAAKTEPAVISCVKTLVRRFIQWINVQYPIPRPRSFQFCLVYPMRSLFKFILMMLLICFLDEVWTVMLKNLELISKDFEKMFLTDFW